MEEKPENQVGEVLAPLEQHTIMFYGKPLVVVRLPNGDPAVVLRYFCDNLKLALTGQIARVNRKKALASGLCYARIETSGGPQVMAVLTLKVTPGWLFGIDASRVSEDMRPEIERYQAECVDVLYEWASSSRLAAPASLVPAESVTKPETPGQGASREQWRDYFLQMATFTDWQISVEEWQGSVENRLESLEALVPDILERLPPPTITARHQNDVKHYVIELGKATNKHPQTIWSMVYTAFQVPTYKDLREADWDKIQQWFRAQFGKAGRTLPGDEQGRLF
jgi:hypothetical protein